MTEPLSNEMADLAERVKAVAADASRAERTAVEKSLEAGAMLVEAKRGCGHGQWAPFLKRAGIHDRQARRLMQLARTQLFPDMVSDLGGIKATLDWLASWSLPTGDDAIVAWRGPDLPTLSRDGDGRYPGAVKPLAVIFPQSTDAIEVVFWSSPDYAQWLNRGVLKDGLWLVLASMVGPHKEMRWQTLYGQGPYWKDRLAEFRQGAA